MFNLTQILFSIIGFLIAITILVTVHELGHFWVARLFGIKVLRFSIGFGRPFFHMYDKHGTEYVLSQIPLGGYVALFGERGGDISVSEKSQAFCYKPVLVRIAVLIAGPLGNFLFAILAYWIIFMGGVSDLAPILGNIPAGSPASLAQLKPRQEIVSIDNKPTPGWQAVHVNLMSALGEHRSINVSVKDKDSGNIETKVLDLSSIEEQDRQENILKELGLIPMDPFPPVIKTVLSGFPGEAAGLQTNDKIIAVNNRPVYSRSELAEYVQPRNGETIQLKVERGAQILEIPVTPIAKRLDDGKIVGFLGIEYVQDQKLPAEFLHVQKFTILGALNQAIKQTGEYTVFTLAMLKKMILGSVSVKHLSGPIAIAQHAGRSVSIGFDYFLNFLAIISISLGIINILPIPLLDGGHIMYCLWELIVGKPVSERTQIFGLWLGGSFILAITLLAIYNDLARF